MDAAFTAIPPDSFAIRCIEYHDGCAISKPTFYSLCPWLSPSTKDYRTSDHKRFLLGWYAGPLSQFTVHMHEYASYRLRRLYLADIILNDGNHFYDHTSSSVWYHVYASYAAPNQPNHPFPKISPDQRQNPRLQITVLSSTEGNDPIHPQWDLESPEEGSTRVLYQWNQFLVRDQQWMNQQQTLLDLARKKMPPGLYHRHSFSHR